MKCKAEEEPQKAEEEKEEESLACKSRPFGKGERGRHEHKTA